MKKFVKVCLIVSAACFLVGVTLCVTAKVMGVSQDDFYEMAEDGGFSFGGRFINRVAGSTHSFDQEFDGIRNLDISMDYGTVEIRTYRNSTIMAEAKNVHSNFRCIKTGDTLEITDEKNRWWSHYDGGGKVILYIPGDYDFDEVSISVGAGTVNAGDLNAEEMSLDLGAGKFDSGNLTVKKDLEVDIGAGNCNIGSFKAVSFSADCGAGTLKAKGDFERDAQIDCGVGSLSLTLTGKEQDYNYEISEAVGQVTVGNQNYSGLDEDKEIDNHAKKDLEINNGMGKTTIAFEK